MESTATHPLARKRWAARRAEIFESVFAPKPKLTISEWSDRHRYLSAVNSAEPGQWRTSRVPYLREIMDAVSDPEVQELVLMKSARVGFTEGVLGNAIAYHIDQDPCPILLVQPSDGDAEKWSKDNLAPMLTDTPALAGKVSDSRSRDSDNTILSKKFEGGALRITGATSPRGLRRLAARKVFFDEIDGYPPSAGTEGDPIALGKKRAQTFWNRQYLYGSTPTIAGFSRVEKLWKISDQRRFYVPCPHCEHRQVLKWGGPDTDYGIKFLTEEIDGVKVVQEESVGYLCENCQTLIEEFDKADMVAAGEWICEKPGRPIRGYHINALYSLFDGARWSVLAQEWIDAQDDVELLKAFINTVLGEVWEERGEAVKPSDLEARLEVLPEGVDVPNGVGVLVAGVDVQGDRLELLVKGYGAGEESWMIAHHRIYGDPDREEVWQRLEALRLMPYQHESGQRLRISATMVDSGYKAAAVYGYVRPRQAQGVSASKGLDTRARAPLSRATKSNRDKVKLFTIGTVAMKDVIMPRLRLLRPGPGFMHFCKQPSDTLGGDAEYFAQFAAEKKVVRRVNGKTVREYLQVRDRNEAIDLEVLALAALHSLGLGVRKQLAELAQRFAVPVGRTATTTNSPAAGSGGRRARRGVRSRGVR